MRSCPLTNRRGAGTKVAYKVPPSPANKASATIPSKKLYPYPTLLISLDLKHQRHGGGRRVHLDRERIRQDPSIKGAVDRALFQLGEVEEEVQNHITQNLTEKGEELRSGLSAIEKKIDDRMNELKKQFKMSQYTALEPVNTSHAATIQTGIYYIVLEKVYYGGYSQPQICRSPTPTYQKVSTSELLNILDVPFDTTNNDLGYILRQSNSFEADILGHGRWLMTLGSFKNWLGGSRSDVLLVDGHFDQAKIGKTSPMSVFCATFIASIVKLQSTIVLHFFCGQHVTFDDSLRGPHGLLRSLICQLLLYPNTPESNLEMLAGDESQAGPTFKVLMTSANRSTEIVHEIPLHQRVSLRVGNVHSGPVSEQAFFAEVLKAKASIEASAPALQGLPWIESNIQPAQAAWDMSRLRIEGAPAAPETLPWATPQQVQTLIDAEKLPSPAPQWATMTPPPQSM
ncbi:uncharacterized protein PAC_02774 [Phialocephala subalpina]|uniref:Nephrocystin 3-like N-terminal domain-containing protein n=1 Tax=Phialocephala subalpina TaxID=576137 RepID=A0A1L7WJE3_9HELO|nr:uncharacterized protein PAC_02774 [Phialocephala subalpina]